jgi:hypothetical protein
MHKRLSRKPANLKSKTEAIERMLKGEAFYNGIQIIRYHEMPSGKSPCYGGVPFNTVSSDIWNNFKRWEIQEG